ncbi:MAG TPA: PQQ-binding-like beta-propeller repeat protein [Polyangiaceae bacterium]|nr:PQQ-binding-like beta-propeller repeat protein [Polyangiaceae bacterium]
MPQLQKSQCPHCGAPLQIPEGAEQVVCAYCSHTSLLQRPDRPARVSTSADVHVIPWQPPRRSMLPFFLIAGVTALSGLIGAVVFLSAATPSTSGRQDVLQQLGQVAKAATERTYFDDHPFTFDVNGDGVLDVLGRNKLPSGPCWFAAFDGKSGEPIWKTEPIAKDACESGSMRTLVGDVLISVDALGKAQAYDAKNGQPRWAGLLGETARSACGTADWLKIAKSDRQDVVLAPATGKPAEAPKTKDCPALATSSKDSNPGQRIIGWSDFDDYGLPSLHAIQGLSAHRALVVDGSDVAFMLGSKSAGSQVAMIAAVQKKKVLWSDVVPGVDPLTTKVNVTTQLAAYGDGKLVVPYALKDSDGGMRMAAFDTATGRRIWDVQVHERTQVDGGLTVAGDTVYYGSWTALYALDAKTGSRRFVIGTEF